MPTRITAASLGGLPIQLDLLARDYESLRETLIGLASQLTPEWTDFYEGDPGVALLELAAYVGALQSYGNDRIQNEGYLPTAQLRSSVVHLLRLINYELKPGSAASVPLVVRTNAAVVLPAGWAVTSKATAQTPALRFELLQSVSLPAAGYWTVSSYAPTLAALLAQPVNTNDDLIVVHGESVANELIGVSDGTPNQTLQLSRTPLALNPDGSSPLVVRVGGIPWTAVDNFLESEPTSEHYKYQIDASGVVSVIFSDGINGKIPPASSTIHSDYRVGGGSVGNSVGANTLKTQAPPMPGVLDVYNPIQPSSGSEPETVDHAKRFGPLALRALNRAVTLEDFETIALQTPGGGIRAARAAHIGGPFEVTVFIAAEGSNPVPSGKWYPELDSGTGVLGAVGRYLTQRKPVPTKLHIFGPTIARPYLSASITVQKNILRDDARFEVTKNLKAFFLSLADDFGIGVPLSRIVQVIENSRGVDWVQVNAFHRKPSARFVRGYETAFLSSSVTISGFQETTRFEEYEIIWQSGNTYQLKGATNGFIKSQAGVILNFTAGVTYSINHYPAIPSDTERARSPQFTINVTLLGPFARRGDVWRFATDNYLGNMAIAEFEIVVPTLTTNGNLDTSEFALTFGGGLG